VSLHTCCFVTPDRGAVTTQRLERLRAFYGAIDHATLHLAAAAPPGWVAGCIAVGAPWGQADWFLWGGLAPVTVADVADPEPARLRRWVGPGAAVVSSARRIVTATSSADAASLYRCGEDTFATHAVAAAYLATGEVRLRPSAVAEIIAFEHPAGDAHLVEGVTAVRPATIVVAGAQGVRVTTHLTPRERWALVPEEEAQEEAERRLHAFLAERIGDRRAWLGLSGGLDSRVVAVATRELGIEVTAYTAGSPDGPEAPGAVEVARRLRLDHRFLPYRTPTAEEAAAGARWTEGCQPLGYGVRSAAGEPGALFLTGSGGELARAFFYKLNGRAWPRPTTAQVAGLWRPEWMLPAGSDDAAHEAVRSAARRMLGAAEAAGLEGWRLLDAVHGDELLRHWGRSRLPPAQAELSGAFLAPDVGAAVVSLPLAARLTDDFHRRYLARHAPDLYVPFTPLQRQRVPAVLRRAAARVRAVRGDAVRRPGPTPVPQEIAGRLTALVADSPVVAAGLGQRAVDVVTEHLTRGLTPGFVTAQSLAAVAELEAAVATLTERDWTDADALPPRPRTPGPA
jgi:hypothetical protein